VRISEIFYSIEGEGIEIGKPEVFVRLANCNLQCAWCDTKYSWNDGQEMSVNEVISEIAKYSSKNVSITGGEPLLQKTELLVLIQHLKNLDYWIQINTNGTLFEKSIFDLADLISMDCKCPSSEMQSDFEVIKQVRELYSSKSQFKLVISNEEDYQHAKNIVTSLLQGAPHIVFQPQWAKRNFSRELVNFVLKDKLNVRVILQQHKEIWGARRGV
jgi:7-carboxy-7-deazaguanine synthase